MLWFSLLTGRVKLFNAVIKVLSNDFLSVLVFWCLSKSDKVMCYNHRDVYKYNVKPNR